MAEVHGVEIAGVGLVAVTSTLANVGGLVDMINREYAGPDGDPVATLVMRAVYYNPAHNIIRDKLDRLPGVTRVTERRTPRAA